MISDEELSVMRRRIDCPIAWCDGSWLDHGVDGGEPETWFHQDSSGVALPHGMTLYRSQEAGGDVTLMLVNSAGGEVAQADCVRVLSEMLRDLAAAVDCSVIGSEPYGG